MRHPVNKRQRNAFTLLSANRKVIIGCEVRKKSTKYYKSFNIFVPWLMKNLVCDKNQMNENCL